MTASLPLSYHAATAVLSLASQLIESEFVPSEEFPEGGPAAIRDLDTHPFLRIQEEEAETWQQTVRPEDIEGLTAVDKKRQGILRVLGIWHWGEALRKRSFRFRHHLQWACGSGDRGTFEKFEL